MQPMSTEEAIYSITQPKTSKVRSRDTMARRLKEILVEAGIAMTVFPPNFTDRASNRKV